LDQQYGKTKKSVFFFASSSLEFLQSFARAKRESRARRGMVRRRSTDADDSPNDEHCFDTCSRSDASSSSRSIADLSLSAGGNAGRYSGSHSCSTAGQRWSAAPGQLLVVLVKPVVVVHERIGRTREELQQELLHLGALLQPTLLITAGKLGQARTLVPLPYCIIATCESSLLRANRFLANS